MSSPTMDDALSAQEQAAEAAERLDLASAITLAARSAAIIEQLEGPSSPDLANLLTDLASYYDRAAHYGDARAAAGRASEILEGLEIHYPGDATLAQLRLNALSQLGTAHRNTGDLAGAERIFRQAIAIARDACGEESEETANACNSLGIVFKYSGRFEEARESYARALSILESLYGKDSQQTATLWHNIGGMLHAAGRFAEALEPGRKAWEIRRAALGDGVPETWFDAVAFAGILDGLERYSESEPIYREALRRYEEWFGPDHFEVAAVLNNLAYVLAARGEFDEARAAMARSLTLKSALFPEGHFERVLAESGMSAIDEMANRKDRKQLE